MTVLRWLVRVIVALRVPLPPPRAFRNRGRGEPAVRFLVHNAYALGGTVQAAGLIAGALARSYDVEIVTTFRHVDEPFFAVPTGVRVRTVVDQRRLEGGGLRAHFVRLLTKSPSVLVPPDEALGSSYSLWSDLQLYRAIRSMRSGVLVTTRVASNVVAARSRRPGLTVMAQEHLPMATHTPALHSAIRRRYRDLDVLMTLTDVDQRNYEKVFPDGRPRVVCIPNVGLAPAADLPAAAEPVILAAGRLVEMKGYDRLIDAFAAVVATHPHWRLRIFGVGPMQAQLQSQIAERGLQGKALLMGGTPDMQAELRKASIVALTSEFEALPTIVVHAMAAGVPVVSFDCPNGPRALITPGQDGVLVPNGDVDALATALSRLIANPARRHDLARAGLISAQRFAPDRIAAQWHDLLDEYDVQRS